MRSYPMSSFRSQGGGEVPTRQLGDSRQSPPRPRNAAAATAAKFDRLTAFAAVEGPNDNRFPPFAHRSAGIDPQRPATHHRARTPRGQATRHRLRWRRLTWPPRRVRNWRSVPPTIGLYRLRRPVGQCPEGPGRKLCSHQVGVYGHCTSIARRPQHSTAALPNLRQGADRMARSDTERTVRPGPETALPPLRNNRPGLALELAPARRLRSQLRFGGGGVSRRGRAATHVVERATRPWRRRLAAFLRAGLTRP